ncbi:MAG: hypothetical protein NZT92_16585 [Abditibacteriales bacterium]|nr:hypothetical protein [Abditibacteriales bacterium]MDW8367505.1 hypothetical protein [Abditibacteriales bacterium]
MTFQMVQYGLPLSGHTRFGHGGSSAGSVMPIGGNAAQHLSACDALEAKREIRNLWTEGGGLTT